MNSVPEEQIEVRGADGARSKLTVFSAAVNGEAPVALCLPAMGVAATFYRPLALALRDAGVHAVTADLRGNGQSSIRADRATSFGYREIVELDLPANVDAIRARFPGRRVFLLGHSLGGQLGVLYAARNPSALDGVALVAASSVYFRAYPFPLNVKVLFGTQLARLVANAYGYFPGDRLRFAGREARGVMNDWAIQALHGDYGGTLDPSFEAALRTARLRVLAVSVDNDTLSPPSSIEHLCSKLKSSNVTRWHLRQELAGERIDHFRWVKRPQPVVARVKEWLGSA